MPRKRSLVEVTAASRRVTERCSGVKAIADFTHQVNPNSPRPEPKVFLGALWFVLSGLGDEIGRRNLDINLFPNPEPGTRN
jgi:hypothetical protein